MTSKLPQFVDEIKDSIESMQETIKILTLGIDYKKYNRFNNLMPLVQQTINGTYHIVRNNWHPRQVGAKVDINYCINFLTELCLTLNEFTPHSESIEIKT